MFTFSIKKPVTSVLLAVFLLVTLFIPFNTTHADTEELEDVRLKLVAIVDYLNRLVPKNQYDALSSEEMVDILENGIDWFVAAQEPSGHFKYEYVPYEDIYLDDDNQVRQAGGLFALGELYKKQSEKDSELATTIESSIQYFEQLSREGESESGEFSCIVERERSGKCKLGTVSLALLGILGYVEGNQEKAEEYEHLISSYVAYIKTSKRDGAGFHSEFHVGDQQFNDKESPFFNGEALLALVRYYQYEPDEEIKDLIDQTFAHLKAEEFNTGLYLWITAALKDMYALWPKPEYVDYTKEFTDWRVAGVSFRKGTDRNYCAYAEGIVSAYSVLEGNVPEAELGALKQEIDFWLAKSATLQLTSESTYRIVEGDTGLRLASLQSPENADGGFLTGHSELTQRIDFTQHCLSSYVQTLEDIHNYEL